MRESVCGKDLNTDDLNYWDRHHYWHSFTQMSEYQPLIIESGQGVWLYDVNGRQLLDGVSSMWCNVHGHRHPVIDAAIREQLTRIAHVTSLGCSNPTSLALVKKLVEITPDGLECVFFGSDGASAVEVALKMAFQYWRQCVEPETERNLFLVLGDAYHGDTLGSVSVGGVSRFHAMFDPLLFEVVRGPCPDSCRLPAGVAQGQASEYYLAQYEQLFRQFAPRLAAVVVEPLVQGAAGMVMHPTGFLKGLRELARHYGVLFVADEIATGIGRTGRMWACDWEEVQPDFLCTGKGLTGGYMPMAATLTTRQVWDAFLGEYHQSRSFFHGHTYGGNPLAAAAALATLELFESEQTLANVERQGAVLDDCLRPLEAHPHVGDIRRRGLMAAIELVSNRRERSPYSWSERRGWRACEAALDKGVWLRPLGNVIVMMPPLCCREEHIEQLAEAVIHGVEAATGG
jgi:adenosylmethionine---8-amino-7-oxononanoate aminotransferase